MEKRLDVSPELEKAVAGARAAVAGWPQWLHKEFRKVERSVPSSPPSPARPW